MKNIFNLIRNQIVNNEVYGSKNTFKVSGVYPENIIVWLTKNKVFKVASVKRNLTEKGFTYEITYKDLFTGSDFLNAAYEAAMYKREKAERNGYIAEEAVQTQYGIINKKYVPSEPVTTKFNNINDKFRQELDCPNWSSEPDETGYAACPNNTESGYEQLDIEDNCCLELVLNEMGYKNYEDYLNQCGLWSSSEARQKLSDEINKFYQNEVAKEYQIGEETVSGEL